ncbi:MULTISPECIES: cupin domain-containing protein [Methylomonas]|uniref:Cupin n=2 Tax=Methylomonas TaxID=416 RepID=A0A140E4V1_9GAMM|nr:MULTISPECIES: cupin domain-containing protein [Methylomonas]AMK75425.1 cupin [Methylomonas denitrificans]OAI01235.1 cupin [Methylomonas methanica]TCV78120.1 quercetin dioxygenase-like cupin family protein [Methylomonas methanica]
MKYLGRIFYLAAALGLFLATSLAANAEQSSAKFTRELLLKKHVTLAAKEVDTNVIRVRFPKGYKTPLHTHEGPGPRYVLKGKLKVEDGGQSNVFGPGNVFWETGAEMTVENVGKGEAEIIIFEMAPAKTAAH